jgi:prephenate dehydrogenase
MRNVRVLAEDIDADVLRKALEDGVIDGTGIESFDECDIIYLSAGTEVAVKSIEALININKGCLITDVGSVKKPITEYAEQLPGLRFVGGHPMAGYERSGYGASAENLFENACYVITPTRYSSDDDIGKISDLAVVFGAVPIVMSAETHDEAAAIISHAPHMVASALAVSAMKKENFGGLPVRGLAAGGFRDITRIASADPSLWRSIVFENKDEVLKALDLIKNEIDGISGFIAGGNGSGLYNYLKHAKDYRDGLPLKIGTEVNGAVNYTSAAYGNFRGACDRRA